MSNTNKIHPQARSWRDITQEVKPRAMSRGGRWRKFTTLCRIAGVVLTVCLLLGGVFIFTELFRDNPANISSVVNAEPVQEITLRTDGVLTQAWMARTLALPAKATLMELDLTLLRDRLLVENQVMSAVLTRKFPATLEVSLSERSPVARINARMGSAAPRPLQVARDGVVYEGLGYDRNLLATLPYLNGVKLVKSGSGLKPISGMEIVANLLATARNEAPHLYQTWKVVSMSRLESDGELEVRASNIDRIIFMAQTSTDFLRQVAQLDALIDTVQAEADQPVNEINLAVGRMTDGRIQVPVSFRDNLPTTQIVRDDKPVSKPLFNPNRLTNLEL